jgi:hypothetical protein
MIQISKHLFVGCLADLREFSLEDDAIVHATQTIHYRIMGWNRTTNKPDKQHPNYILWEDKNRLSVNWVDGGAYLYKWSGVKTFIRILDFIDMWIEERKVFIHCDQGQSRSPTLGLLYLAKRKHSIASDTFLSASKEFREIYSLYQPKGIGDYVKQHWNEIN